MCGEGPLRGAVERQIEDLGLGDQVELLGFVDNPFPLMRAADLIVSTSDFEGLPNSLIEAQGLGLPAVATRCPHGVDEVVEDGTTGRLAPPGDAPAIAAAIEELLAGGRESLERLGAAARAVARRRFALEAALPGWTRLLLDAAGRG
jgi:glycosyltransferase involved in cell wall biosynthesis